MLMRQNAASSKTALRLALAVLVGLGFSGPASARPARCDVQVEGFRSYSGPCDFEARKGGSFTLARPGSLLLRTNPGTLYVDEDSVAVKLLAPDIALLFDIGGAHQRGTCLATLYRQGACWVSRPPKDETNGDARVCAK